MNERYELEGGKYTIVNDNGVITALRYGEPWREFVGDNLIGSLVEEVRRLHQANEELLVAFKDIVSDYEFSEKVAGYGPRAFAYYETAKRIVAKATGVNK